MAAARRAVLIDDDADLRSLSAATLQFMAGWEVATAVDGADGIEVVRRELPDIVIVDLMMPSMDGYEVCRRLRADPVTARIPLVILTARTSASEQEARAAGAVGVIFKPFDPERLDAEIDALLSASPNDDSDRDAAQKQVLAELHAEFSNGLDERLHRMDRALEQIAGNREPSTCFYSRPTSIMT